MTNDSAPPDDAKLLRRIADGDQLALERVFDRHSAATYHTALGCTGDASAAETVTASVFLELWKRPDQCVAETNGGGLSAWLAAMACQRATQADHTPAAATRPKPRPRTSWTVALLRTLPARDRALLESVIFDGDDLAHAAVRQQMSVVEAAIRLTAALRQLSRAFNGPSAPDTARPDGRQVPHHDTIDVR
ncbi:DNA-directed RNA polymerase specialized sigma subunit, sigma24 family [Amycolatopsis arida]|uniref:DNA-directed RNA polymerase specialized sigma subunit, sigma24 family n=1 Tax=Amycolatopsis arida TaxID=587909 RepID=A0A1I5ZD96_9PSEU|nr:hypothetical protein [Amycolatopsis arida]TDX89543.1 DNA-directed RNA polymerase specialized sigma24 family protein [Amycolatopsis arida]SFQ54420.1 DNA-directed RNA polymerase specialized sigma subunit, sigma24 family [Amycolatopsis arida]